MAWTTGDMCCCVKDRSLGAKIVGFTYIVLSFVAMIGMVFELVKYRTDKAGYNATVLAKFYPDFGLDQGSKFDWFELLLSGLIVFSLVCLLVNVCMILGVSFNKWCLITPWIAYQVLLALFFIFGAIFYLYVNQHIAREWDQNRWQVLMMLLPIGMGILALYFWIHVKLEMDSIKEGSEAEEEPPTPAKDTVQFVQPTLAFFPSGKNAIADQPSVINA